MKQKTIKQLKKEFFGEKVIQIYIMISNKIITTEETYSILNSAEFNNITVVDFIIFAQTLGVAKEIIMTLRKAGIC